MDFSPLSCKNIIFNFIIVFQMVGRVDFIVFFQQIPVNKVIFNAKTRTKSQKFFEIAKIK